MSYLQLKNKKLRLQSLLIPLIIDLTDLKNELTIPTLGERFVNTLLACVTA